MCYADVIWTRNKHGDSKYPLIPGYVLFKKKTNFRLLIINFSLLMYLLFPLRHEIVGIVSKVGYNVHRFKVGDHVGVGTYVNSCRECEYCNQGQEVSCVKGQVFTFNAIDYDGSVTKGGYSSHIVVHERFT